MSNPDSGSKELEDTVEQLLICRQKAKRIRGRLFQLQASDSKDAKQQAEEIILLGQEFDKHLGIAISRLERVDEEVEIPLKEVQPYDMLGMGYNKTTADKEEIDIRLYDVQSLFERDIMQVCEDIRKGLAPKEELDNVRFFDGEEKPRDGYQILCKIYAGMKSQL